MKHRISPILRLPWLFGSILALAAWGNEALPTSSDIDHAVYRVRLESLNEFINRLDLSNDPEAIFRLLDIYHGLKGQKPADDVKVVAFRAMDVIRSKENHAEIIAGRIRELSKRPSTYSDREALMASLRQIRTEQAVRVVGEFLYDDFSMPIQLFEDHSSDDGPNRRPAASTLIQWLRGLEGYSDDLRVSANSPPHKVLREWWSARKDDPDFIRAVAKGLPIPPVKQEPLPSRSAPPAKSDPPNVKAQVEEKKPTSTQAHQEQSSAIPFFRLPVVGLGAVLLIVTVTIIALTRRKSPKRNQR